MASSKTRTQMIIGTSIVGIFAALILGVFSSFQSGTGSIDNQSNATTPTSIPVADTPFYR
jgi:hypothetical protein